MNPQQKIYFIKVFFTLLQKSSKTDEIIEKLKEAEKTATDFKRIRCPKCNWQPKKESLWYCCDCDYPEYFYDSCGTAWNTFDTRGKCPVCRHQWRFTTCLSCGNWSRHEDWYQKDAAK